MTATTSSDECEHRLRALRSRRSRQKPNTASSRIGEVAISQLKIARQRSATMFANANSSSADPYPDRSGDPYQSHCSDRESDPAIATGMANAMRFCDDQAAARSPVARGWDESGPRSRRRCPRDQAERSVATGQQKKQIIHAAVTGTSLIGWIDWMDEHRREREHHRRDHRRPCRHRAAPPAAPSRSPRSRPTATTNIDGAVRRRRSRAGSPSATATPADRSATWRPSTVPGRQPSGDVRYGSCPRAQLGQLDRRETARPLPSIAASLR